MHESPKSRMDVDHTVPFDDAFDWDSVRTAYGRWTTDNPSVRENWVAYATLRDLGLTMAELKGKRMLDVGAGSGTFARVAKRSGVDAIALDIQVLEQSKKSGTPMVQGSAYQLPFLEGTFDLVISHGGPLENIHWAQDQVARSADLDGLAGYPAISEALRVLRPGGEMRFQFHMNTQPDVLGRNEQAAEFVERIGRLQGVSLDVRPVAIDETISILTTDQVSLAEVPVRVTCDRYLITLRKL